MIALIDGDDAVQAGACLLVGIRERVAHGEHVPPGVIVLAKQLAARRGQHEATSGQNPSGPGRRRDTEPVMATLADAARTLACSTRTVRRRVAAGQLAARRDGRRLLFHRDELNRYLASLDTP